MRDALEVADIFRGFGPKYRAAQAGHLSLDQLRVMSAIERCRTAALGGHVEGCADCGHQRIAYNSCRNRHCPKCQGAAARAWLAEREADLLPVGYFHVVFSLPAEIAAIAWINKAAVYDLLFRAAAETMLTIAADRKHLGARIGISNRRLVAMDEAGITFRYKNYRQDGAARYQTMTLPPAEFIRRFLLHVLPKGFHRIRHYGLLASASRKANIARIREFLAVPQPVPEETATLEAAPETWRRCPCCGGQMMIIEVLARTTFARAPPSTSQPAGRWNS